MKKISFIASFILSALLMTASVSAANMTPSIERKDKPDVVSSVSSDGQQYNLIITSLKEAHISVEQGAEGLNEIQKNTMDELVKIQVELEKVDLDKDVNGFTEQWKEATDGAPAANAAVMNVFDISSTDPNVSFSGKKIIVTMEIPNVTSNDKFVVIHKVDDKWKVEKSTINSKGQIVLELTSLSPFAIIVDNGAAPTTDGSVTSPKTGVDETSAAVVAAVCAGICGLCFAFKAKRLRSR